jgi:hypothetical protein
MMHSALEAHADEYLNQVKLFGFSVDENDAGPIIIPSGAFQPIGQLAVEEHIRKGGK